jgi:hypothetical protein
MVFNLSACCSLRSTDGASRDDDRLYLVLVKDAVQAVPFDAAGEGFDGA